MQQNDLLMRKHESFYSNQFEKDPIHLEPRVVKLEAGLDRLTDDVRSLTEIVRGQSSHIDSEMQKLMVAVTQAAGPRKTDWATIISGLFLVMAIGSAVFWPLNQLSQNNSIEIKNLETQISEHLKKDNHPVGVAKIENMEQKFTDLVNSNQRNLDLLDKKLQRETELITTEIKNQVSTISGKYDREISDLGNRLLGRINSYDQLQLQSNQRDLEELRQWRLKAMGLNNSGFVPGAAPSK